MLNPQQLYGDVFECEVCQGYDATGDGLCQSCLKDAPNDAAFHAAKSQIIAGYKAMLATLKTNRAEAEFIAAINATTDMWSDLDCGFLPEQKASIIAEIETAFPKIRKAA